MIHGKTNTEALAQGFLRLLSNYVESKNTYLPQSVIEISFFEDLLIVFWRLLHSNPNFLEEVVQSPGVMEKAMTAVLLCFDMNKKDPHKSNMLYICVFILLTMSSSREFSLLLNEQQQQTGLPFDLPDHVSTTYGNLLIAVIFRAIQVGT